MIAWWKQKGRDPTAKLVVLSDAMTMYKQALAIDPNSAQAHYNLGLAFAEQKIFNEAVREWQIVIKSDPNSDLGKTAAENVKIITQYNSK